jgi:hypothetical protein
MADQYPLTCKERIMNHIVGAVHPIESGRAEDCAAVVVGGTGKALEIVRLLGPSMTCSLQIPCRNSKSSKGAVRGEQRAACRFPVLSRGTGGWQRRGRLLLGVPSSGQTAVPCVAGLRPSPNFWDGKRNALAQRTQRLRKGREGFRAVTIVLASTLGHFLRTSRYFQTTDASVHGQCDGSDAFASFAHPLRPLR